MRQNAADNDHIRVVECFFFGRWHLWNAVPPLLGIQRKVSGIRKELLQLFLGRGVQKSGSSRFISGLELMSFKLLSEETCSSTVP